MPIGLPLQAPGQAFAQGAKTGLGLAQAPQMHQLNQLKMLQAQAELQRQPLLDEQAQLGLDANRAKLQEAQVSQQLQKILRAGTFAEAAKALPIEKRRAFLESLEPIVGKFNEGEDTDETLDEIISKSEAARKALMPDNAPIKRFDTKVVGDSLILTDAVTGQQTVSEFGSNVSPPPGLSPSDEELFKQLPKKEQQKIVSDNIIKRDDRLAKAKTIKKGELLKERAVTLIDSILKAKKLGDVLGPIEGSFDIRLDADEAEIITDIQELGDILTGENLDLMTGVLSESDIKIIRSIGGGATNRKRKIDSFRDRMSMLRDAMSKPKTKEELNQEADNALPPIPETPKAGDTFTVNGVTVKRLN